MILNRLNFETGIWAWCLLQTPFLPFLRFFTY
jgi:hypothetical protein